MSKAGPPSVASSADRAPAAPSRGLCFSVLLLPWGLDANPGDSETHWPQGLWDQSLLLSALPLPRKPKFSLGPDSSPGLH